MSDPSEFNTETYESCHHFASTGLEAKVPDCLTTCNTVEPESAICSEVKVAESSKELT